MINETTKEKIKNIRIELQKLNKLDIEKIVNQFQDTKILEFVEVNLPFYGHTRLAVCYGYYSSSSGGFTADPELKFLHPEDSHESPKKKYPHDVMGGFGDAYAVSIVTEDLKAFRRHSTSSLFGDPLNDVGGIQGLVRKTLEYWVKHENIIDMMPSEIFECPFKDDDEGNFRIESSDVNKMGGEVAAATTFKEAKQKKDELEDHLYRKEHGNVNIYNTISCNGTWWLMPPVGHNYVEVVD